MRSMLIGFISISLLLLQVPSVFSSGFFSADEIQQLQFGEEDWVDEIYQYRLDQNKSGKSGFGITRGINTPTESGPTVLIMHPERTGDHYRAFIPLRLLVYFKGQKAPVDIDSLKIKGKRGFFTVDITERTKKFLRHPQQGEDAEYVIDAKIPKIGAGRYLIVLTVADTAGNLNEQKAFLEVSKN
ncbi:MAG: hypothetical protein D6B25_03545 [Desulfobulbaceae bacterium]|nr:MAG: hypothetical protein D6B25_03545 [Desulfobulbaceae bacterium]